MPLDHYIQSMSQCLCIQGPCQAESRHIMMHGISSLLWIHGPQSLLTKGQWHYFGISARIYLNATSGIINEFDRCCELGVAMDDFSNPFSDPLNRWFFQNLFMTSVDDCYLYSPGC